MPVIMGAPMSYWLKRKKKSVYTTRSFVVRACNFYMRALRHIRCCVSQDNANTIACRIVGSRLNYCNAPLSDAQEPSLPHAVPSRRHHACGMICQPPSELPLNWLISKSAQDPIFRLSPEWPDSLGSFVSSYNFFSKSKNSIDYKKDVIIC